MKNFNLEQIKNVLKGTFKNLTLAQVVYYGTIPFFGIITLVIGLVAANADGGLGGKTFAFSLWWGMFLTAAFIIVVVNCKKNEDKILLASDVETDKLAKAIMPVFKIYRKAILIALAIAIVFVLFAFFVVAIEYDGNFGFVIKKMFSAEGLGVTLLLWMDVIAVATAIVLFIKSIKWAKNFNEICKT